VGGTAARWTRPTYQRTVDTLLAGGSDPVITAEPEGAWTHAITDAALFCAAT
jgi:NitT/TauT family transport system substrate-binding protein